MMSAPEKKTVLGLDLKLLDRESPDSEDTFSQNFDPEKTAAKDAEEVIWKYADEIGEAISK